MRPFFPPQIQTFDTYSSDGDSDPIGPVRNAAYEVGYEAGWRAGHSAGFAEGETQARSASASEIVRLNAMLDEQQACSNVSDVLHDLLSYRDADRRQIWHETRSATATALDVLFPTLMAQTVGAEIVVLIDEALNARISEGIAVRASPETIEAIRSLGLSEHASARVTLHPDPGQPFGVADIAWTGGGMTFDPQALLRRVTEAVSPVFIAKDEMECRT